MLLEFQRSNGNRTDWLIVYRVLSVRKTRDSLTGTQCVSPTLVDWQPAHEVKWLMEAYINENFTLTVLSQASREVSSSKVTEVGAAWMSVFYCEPNWLTNQLQDCNCKEHTSFFWQGYNAFYGLLRLILIHVTTPKSMNSTLIFGILKINFLYTFW